MTLRIWSSVQDFWPAHASSMAVWLLSAESRSRDISSSTTYFSFSFIYLFSWASSTVFSFFLQDYSLRCLLNISNSTTPVIQPSLFLNRKFIYILGGGRKKKAEAFTTTFILLLMPDVHNSWTRFPLPIKQHLGWLGKVYHLGALILLPGFWVLKQHFQSFRDFYLEVFRTKNIIKITNGFPIFTLLQELEP